MRLLLTCYDKVLKMIVNLLRYNVKRLEAHVTNYREGYKQTEQDI